MRGCDTLTNTHLGVQLKKTLKRAIKGAKLQRKEANMMTHAWGSLVYEWRKMLRAYKKDQSNPNPFEEPQTGRFTFVSASVVG